MKYMISLGFAALLGSSLAVAEKTGEQVYQASCGTCHNTGVSGAQKLDETDKWKARLAERGRDGLVKSSINGFNAMPAKGLCFACTDAELAAAVDYMLATAGAVDGQASADAAANSNPDAAKTDEK